VRDAIVAYLELLDEEAPKPTLELLLERLDRLLAAFHDLGADVLEGDAPDPPDLHAAAGIRFPDLGYYPGVDPTAPLDRTDLWMEDAIDDVGDIARDLWRALWLWDNVSPEAGAGLIRLFYPHWGAHARGLQRYLHARLWAF
jgi:hypothetical protein